MGIGTLNEKSIHNMLKSYIDEDNSHHEIRVGNFIADVVNQTGIFEIQTKHFSNLREKLDYYLPRYPVTVIYPTCTVRYLNWVDPTTGDIIERRKSSTEKPINIFRELYQIRDYLYNDNLCFKIVMLVAEDYKKLDGRGRDKKNHATKVDKVPTNILGELNFNKRQGYKQFIPNGLPDKFNSEDFSRQAHCNMTIARQALLILTELGYVERVGKDGKRYIYTVS